jgi:hypothetical protein
MRMNQHREAFMPPRSSSTQVGRNPIMMPAKGEEGKSSRILFHYFPDAKNNFPSSQNRKLRLNLQLGGKLDLSMEQHKVL